MSELPKCSPELRAKYEQHGQDHVLRFLDEGKLSPSEAQALLTQLESIDVATACNYFSTTIADAKAGAALQDLTPPNPADVMMGSKADQSSLKSWENLSFAAIRRGELAACVLAGGQGTRLGIDGPKGAYSIGLPSNKSLFQLFVERLSRLKQLASAEENSTGSPSLPFLIMTSPINHDETKSFFEQHNFFGYDQKDIIFFKQGVLPAFSPDGKFIMESGSLVSTSPDGNGGIYPSLQNSGALSELCQRGVKYLHVFGVDNAVVRPADPRFVGYCIEKGAYAGNKSVWKRAPGEKVGVIARRGDKYCVAEYSELDDARKELTDNLGSLVFGAGNICNHFFSVQFLTETVIPNLNRIYHVANKKIPYADENGQTVKPEKNNGIKLEAFIFDIFTMVEGSKFAIYEVAREEFAPVKNPPGDAEDSPDTARAIVNKVSRQWIQAAGGKINGAADAIVEVSTLASYAGEGLEFSENATYTAPCQVP